MDAPMLDCEKLIALKRVQAFLGEFDHRSKDAVRISLGLRFINLDEQQPEDSQDDDIVESTNSMSDSDLSGDSKADSAEVEDGELIDSSISMPDSDYSVESDADDGVVTRKRKLESPEGESP